MRLSIEDKLGSYLPFLKKIGINKCLVLGALGHFTFVFAQVLPAWRSEYFIDTSDPNEEDADNKVKVFLQKKGFVIVCLVISVIINGVGAAILWVAEGEYMSKCATEDTKGFYFGMFWSIYQAS